MPNPTMSVVNLNLSETYGPGPTQCGESNTNNAATEGGEVLFTRVVSLPGKMVRDMVGSSLSSYLKLVHNMGILYFTEDQVVVVGWRKWIGVVSTKVNYTRSFY